MKRRLLLVVLLGLVVFACATSAFGRKKHIYRVENFNWHTATLIFECQGHVLKRVHQIGTGRRVQGEVVLRECPAPRFAIRLLASQNVYISEPLTGWNRNTILDIRIENYLPLTSYMILNR